MKICPICKADYGRGEVFCPTDGARLSTPSQMVSPPLDARDPLVGSTLSERYKILRQIGEGGMGIVYEAQHVVIEKRVALKVLRDDFSKRPEVVERFRQEAKSASRIGHEHIVDISDFGETPSGQSFFVMEYLDGEDLANVLGRERTIAPERAVHIVMQCAKALGAAHAKGIVHRDMKPENVFLVARGEQPDFVKIVDFGIAKMSDIETEGAPGRKLTKTGMIFGTPEYMSPEQAAGKPLDHRVDVYALGVILYEALAGRVPFVGDTFMGILTQHMFEDVPSLRSINPEAECSEELELVISRALAKSADERYQTMDELARAIAGAMDMSGSWVFHDATHPGYGEPVRAVRRGPRLVASETAATAEFPGTERRSGRTGLVVGALAVLLCAAGVGSYLAFRPGTSEANDGDTQLVVVGGEPQAGGSSAGETPPEGSGGESAGAGRPDSSSGPEAGGGGAAGAEAPPGVPDAPRTVAVQVDTLPTGAEVEVEGRGAVCAPTPCSFETPAGERIRIVTTRGAARAERDVLPVEAMGVEMRLVRRGRPAGGGAAMTGDAAGASGMMTGGAAGDLKFPEIFRSGGR